MSRIGRLPVKLPEKVRVAVDGRRVKVEGPKGKLSLELAPAIVARVENGQLLVARPDESREARSLHGLSRTLLANAVHGVTQGFERVLEISGVGFRAEAKGKQIHFALGYSHPVIYDLPEGVTAEVEKQTRIALRSADKQLLGLTAAQIRKLRLPEPYKGKGIKYAEEKIRRKVGKTGAA